MGQRNQLLFIAALWAVSSLFWFSRGSGIGALVGIITLVVAGVNVRRALRAGQG